MIGHILLAVAIQAAIALPLRNWAGGAAAATAWSLAREITQAEYRWIEHFGNGLRVNMPWWGGLDPQVWIRVDPWLDWIVPTVAVIIVAWLASRRRSKEATARV